MVVGSFSVRSAPVSWAPPMDDSEADYLSEGF